MTSHKLVLFLLLASMLPLFCLCFLISITSIVLLPVYAMNNPFCEYALPYIVNIVLSSVALITCSYGLFYMGNQSKLKPADKLHIIKLKSANDQALTFFVSIIIPIISIGTISGWTGFVSFWTIIGFIIPLLIRTRYCFRNPILVLLGYNIYIAELSNHNKKCYLISHTKLTEDTFEPYIFIEDGYYYIKRKKC